MIINWLNKKLNHVSSDSQFKYYFEHTTGKVEDNSIYLTNAEKGIELILTMESVITSIHFFSGKQNGSKEFSEELPDGLKFSSSREIIHSLFGEPKKTGGGFTNFILGKISKWDKYIYDTHTVRFEYSDNEDEILLITYACKELEKYFSSNLQ